MTGQKSDFSRVERMVQAKEFVTYDALKEALSPEARHLVDFTEERIKAEKGLEIVDILPHQTTVTGGVFFRLFRPATLFFSNMRYCPESMYSASLPVMLVVSVGMADCVRDSHGEEIPYGREHSHIPLLFGDYICVLLKESLNLSCGYRQQYQLSHSDTAQNEEIIARNIHAIGVYNLLAGNAGLAKRAAEIKRLCDEVDQKIDAISERYDRRIDARRESLEKMMRKMARMHGKG